MGQYSIKDVETLSGVKAHTLRVWEQRYHFLKPQRSDTNIRYYTDEQLKLILNISTLNRTGMKISKIACLENEELCREVQKLSEEQVEPNAQLDALIHSMIDFDEARFEKTISCSVVKHGFEKTFSDLIFPLLSRAGILWSTGAIQPAQEHFISNLVRRKILAAIDGQYVQKNAESKRYALFLPEGETHELTLLFTEYLLRKRNHEVVYLGTSVPLKDVEFVCKSFDPHFLVAYFTIPLADTSVQEYVSSLATAFPDKKLIIGGKQVSQQKIQSQGNIRSVCCVNDLINAIN